MDDLEKYTQFVYGEDSGYVYAPVKRTDSWDPEFFAWPNEREKLHDWIRTNGRDPEASAVYISPVLYSEKRAVKAAVKSARVVWVEFDGKTEINFQDVTTKPGMILQTSEASHIHCYWKVEKASPESVEETNRRLTYYLDADTSGWDITQLLRPPETFNRKPKYEAPLPVHLKWYEPQTVDLKTFDVAPAIEVKHSTVEVEQLINPFEVFKNVFLEPDLLKRVKRETVGEGSRSSFLSRIAFELVEAGLEHLQVVSLLYYVDNRIGKFKGRTDQLLRLTQLADLAFHKTEAQSAAVVYTLKDVLEHTDNLEYILPGWLHTHGQMILSSAPGVGKTQFCMQLGVSLVNGLNFLGKSSSLSRKEKVMVWSREMDIRELKYIIKHQSKEYPDDMDWDRFLVVDETMTYSEYEKLIDRYRPTVIVIDSLSELIDEFDNPTKGAMELMRWIKKIRRTFNLAVILIHHNRKANDTNKKPKTLSDLYGSFLFGKDTETVGMLWDTGGGEDSSAAIELSFVKARFGKKGIYGNLKRNEHLWFRLDDGNEVKVIVDASKQPRGTKSGPSLHFEFGK